jgi:Flp pilus assembly protein TadD
MWSRLSRRGLAISLSIVALLFVSPTPVPRHVVEAWTATRTAARAGDTLSAEQALTDVQLFSGWLPPLKADTIRLALANGNGELALALLEAPPAPQAPQATVECWRAEALALLGQWEQAAKALSSTETANCFNPGSLLKDLATRELASNNLTTATAILQSLASLYPEDVGTTSLLGACLTLKDPGAALTTIQLAASRGDPLSIDLAEALGNTSPGDVSASLAALGQVFMQHELWPLAVEAFRQLILLEPENASSHAYFGLALDQQGLDGLTEIEMAARLDPESPLAQSLLGLHWQLQDQPQKAIPYLEYAVRLEPENSAFRASLATARAEAGDVQAAITDYRQAAELRPTDPIFWRLLATFSIAQELELADTGLPAARNAVVLDSEDPASLDLAGYAHFQLGDLVTAERLMARSIDLDPMSASARLHYGLLLSNAGRTSEARAQLVAAAGIGGTSPTGQLAQRALAKLGD